MIHAFQNIPVSADLSDVLLDAHAPVQLWSNLLNTNFDFPRFNVESGIFWLHDLVGNEDYWLSHIDDLSVSAALWLMADTQKKHEYGAGGRERTHIVSHLDRFLFFKKWWRSVSMFNINPDSGCETPDEYFTLSLLIEIRIQDKVVYGRRTNICQSVFVCEFTSKRIKIPFSIIWNCTFLNYSSQGIEAPRSFKFFISAQLQTVDLVKGTQFWGVGIAAGRSWQDSSVSRRSSLLHYSKAKEQIQVN